MINSFKKVIRYILLYTLKYTPVIGWVVQEACNKEVRRKPRSSEFVPDIFKTQELSKETVEKDPYNLKFVPDHFKTQDRQWEMTFLFCSMLLIVLQQGSGYKCDMITVNIVMMMRIIFLSGTRVIRNESSKSLNKRRALTHSLAPTIW